MRSSFDLNCRLKQASGSEPGSPHQIDKPDAVDPTFPEQPCGGRDHPLAILLDRFLADLSRLTAKLVVQSLADWREQIGHLRDQSGHHFGARRQNSSPSPATTGRFCTTPTILYDFLRLMVAPLCPRDRSAIAFISLDVLLGIGFGAIGPLSLPTSKDDAGVDASEAETVRNCMLHRHAPGLAGDEVDAFRGRVAIFEIESGRRCLVP